MTQRGGDPPNLALLAFGHDDAQRRASDAAFGDLDEAGRGFAVFEKDALLPLFERFGGRQAQHFDAVGFAVAVARVAEPLRRSPSLVMTTMPSLSASSRPIENRCSSRPIRSETVSRLSPRCGLSVESTCFGLLSMM